MKKHYSTRSASQKDSPVMLIVGAILTLMLLSCFIWIASHRLVARDEGFYAFAVRLVSDGYLPYSDFFYPQMPLLPYVYALWSLIAGDSYLSLRIFSALISSIIGLQLFYLLKRSGVSILISAVAPALYVFSTLTFSWFATIQTYGLSVVFLLSGLLLCLREDVRPWQFFLSGLCLSLAAMVRLYFAVLIPLVWIAFPGVRRSVFFYLGVFLPVPVLFLVAPFDLLWFNNIGYHLIRSTTNMSESLEQKWHVAEVLFGLRSSVKFEGWQYQILLFSAVVSAVLFFRSSRTVRCLTLAGFGLFFVSFLPSPVYVQYFCVTIPFFSALTAILYYHIYSLNKVAGTGAVLLLLGIYLFHVPGDVRRYTETGEGVIGISNRKNAREWNLHRLDEVSEMLKQHVPKGQEVSALWPGHLVGTTYVITPGIENHFGFLVADQLTAEQRQRFKILSKSELQEKIAKGEVPYLVSWRRTLRSGFLKALKKGGYQKVDSRGDISLYALRS